MHGCYYPHIVFGWREGNDCNCLDEDWLDEMQISWYCRETIRNHAVEIVYGAPCVLNEETGEVVVSDEDLDLVRQAHARAQAASPLGYYRALSGDAYLGQHTKYFPESQD